MIFRHSDGMAARMWQAAKRRIPFEARDMLDGKITKLKKGPFNRLVSFIFRIEHPAMHMIGKSFKVTDACTGCGKCARLPAKKHHHGKRKTGVRRALRGLRKVFVRLPRRGDKDRRAQRLAGERQLRFFGRSRNRRRGVPLLQALVYKIFPRGGKISPSWGG